MIIADSFIYELGEYTIRKQPLALNPAFSTHLIFFKGVLVGRQFSVPCISDCNWYRATRGVYAQPKDSHFHSGGYLIENLKEFMGRGKVPYGRRKKPKES